MKNGDNGGHGGDDLGIIIRRLNENFSEFSIDALLAAISEDALSRSGNKEICLSERRLASRPCMELDQLLERMIDYEKILEYKAPEVGRN